MDKIKDFLKQTVYFCRQYIIFMSRNYLRAYYVNKVIAVTITVCFITNILGPSAFAARTDLPGEKEKKDKERIEYVLSNPNIPYTPAAIAQLKVKVETNGVISVLEQNKKSWRPIGFWNGESAYTPKGDGKFSKEGNEGLKQACLQYFKNKNLPVDVMMIKKGAKDEIEKAKKAQELASQTIPAPPTAEAKALTNPANAIQTEPIQETSEQPAIETPTTQTEITQATQETILAPTALVNIQTIPELLNLLQKLINPVRESQDIANQGNEIQLQTDFISIYQQLLIGIFSNGVNPQTASDTISNQTDKILKSISEQLNITANVTKDQLKTIYVFLADFFAGGGTVINCAVESLSTLLGVKDTLEKTTIGLTLLLVDIFSGTFDLVKSKALNQIVTSMSAIQTVAKLNGLILNAFQVNIEGLKEALKTGEVILYLKDHYVTATKVVNDIIYYLDSNGIQKTMTQSQWINNLGGVILTSASLAKETVSKTILESLTGGYLPTYSYSYNAETGMVYWNGQIGYLSPIDNKVYSADITNSVVRINEDMTYNALLNLNQNTISKEIYNPNLFTSFVDELKFVVNLMLDITKDPRLSDPKEKAIKQAAVFAGILANPINLFSISKLSEDYLKEVKTFLEGLNPGDFINFSAGWQKFASLGTYIDILTQNLNMTGVFQISQSTKDFLATGYSNLVTHIQQTYNNLIGISTDINTWTSVTYQIVFNALKSLNLSNSIINYAIQDSTFNKDMTTWNEVDYQGVMAKMVFGQNIMTYINSVQVTLPPQRLSSLTFLSKAPGITNISYDDNLKTLYFSFNTTDLKLKTREGITFDPDQTINVRMEYDGTITVLTDKIYATVQDEIGYFYHNKVRTKGIITEDWNRYGVSGPEAVISLRAGRWAVTGVGTRALAGSKIYIDDIAVNVKSGSLVTNYGQWYKGSQDAQAYISKEDLKKIATGYDVSENLFESISGDEVSLNFQTVYQANPSDTVTLLTAVARAHGTFTMTSNQDTGTFFGKFDIKRGFTFKVTGDGYISNGKNTESIKLKDDYYWAGESKFSVRERSGKRLISTTQGSFTLSFNDGDKISIFKGLENAYGQIYLLSEQKMTGPLGKEYSETNLARFEIDNDGDLVTTQDIVIKFKGTDYRIYSGAKLSLEQGKFKVTDGIAYTDNVYFANPSAGGRQSQAQINSQASFQYAVGEAINANEYDDIDGWYFKGTIYGYSDDNILSALSSASFYSEKAQLTIGLNKSFTAGGKSFKSTNTTNTVITYRANQFFVKNSGGLEVITDQDGVEHTYQVNVNGDIYDYILLGAGVNDGYVEKYTFNNFWDDSINRITKKTVTGYNDHSKDRVETYTYQTQSDNSIQNTITDVKYTINTAKSYKITQTFDVSSYSDVVIKTMSYYGYTDHSQDRTESYTYMRYYDDVLRKIRSDIEYTSESGNVLESHAEIYAFEADNTVGQMVQRSFTYQTIIPGGGGGGVPGIGVTDMSKDRVETYTYTRVPFTGGEGVLRTGTQVRYSVNTNKDYDLTQNYFRLDGYQNWQEYSRVYNYIYDDSQDRIEGITYDIFSDGTLRKQRLDVSYVLDIGKNYSEIYGYEIVHGVMLQTSMIYSGVYDHSNDRTETYLFDQRQADGSLIKTGLRVQYLLNTQKDYNESYVYSLDDGELSLVQMVHDGVIDNSETRTESYTYFRSANGTLQKLMTAVDYSANGISYNVAKNYIENYYYGVVEGQFVQTGKDHITTFLLNGLIDQSQCWKEEYDYSRSLAGDGSLQKTGLHYTYINLDSTENTLLTERSYDEYYTYELQYGENVQNSMTHTGRGTNTSQDRIETYTYSRSVIYNSVTYSWDNSLKKTQVIFDYTYNKTQSRIEGYIYEFDNTLGDVVQSMMIYSAIPYAGDVNDPNNTNVDRSNDRIEVYEYERKTDGSIQKTDIRVNYLLFAMRDYEEINTYTYDWQNGQLVMNEMRHQGLDSATNGFSADHSQDRTESYDYDTSSSDGAITYAWDGSLRKIDTLIMYDNNPTKNVHEIDIYGGYQEFGQTVLKTKITEHLNYDGTINLNDPPTREDYSYGNTFSLVLDPTLSRLFIGGEYNLIWDGSLQKTQSTVTYGTNDARNYTEHYGYQVASGEIVLGGMAHINLMDASENRAELYHYNQTGSQNPSDAVRQADGTLKVLAMQVLYLQDYNKCYTKTFAYEKDMTRWGAALQTSAGYSGLDWYLSDGTFYTADHTADRTENYNYSRAVDGSWKIWTVEKLFTRTNAKNVLETYRYDTFYGEIRESEINYTSLSYDHSQDRTETYQYERQTDGSLQKTQTTVNYGSTDQRNYQETYTYCDFAELAAYHQLVMTEMSHIGLQYTDGNGNIVTDTSEDKTEHYTYGNLVDEIVSGDMNGDGDTTDTYSWDGSLRKTQTSCVYTASSQKNYIEKTAYQTIEGIAVEKQKKYIGTNDNSNDRIETYSYARSAGAATWDGSLQKVEQQVRYAVSSQKDYDETYTYKIVQGDTELAVLVHDGIYDDSESRTESYTYYLNAEDGSVQKAMMSVDYSVNGVNYNVSKNYVEYYTWGLKNVDRTIDYGQLVMLTKTHISTYELNGQVDASQNYQEEYEYGTSATITENDGTTTTYYWDGSLQRTKVSVRYSNLPYFYQDNNFYFEYWSGTFGSHRLIYTAHGTMEGSAILALLAKGATAVYDSTTGKYKLIDPASGMTYVYKDNGTDINNPDNYTLADIFWLIRHWFNKAGETVYLDHPLTTIPDDPKNYSMDIAYQNINGKVVEYKMKYTGTQDHSKDRLETYGYATSIQEYSTDLNGNGTTNDSIIWDGSLQRIQTVFDYTFNKSQNHIENTVYEYDNTLDSVVQRSMVYSGLPYSGDVNDSNNTNVDRSNDRIEFYGYTSEEDGSIQKTNTKVFYSFNIARNYEEQYTFDIGIRDGGGNIVTNYGELVMTQLRHQGLSFTVGTEIYTDNSQNRTETYIYGTDYFDGTTDYSWDGSLKKVETITVYDNDASKNVQETEVYGGLVEYGRVVLMAKITTPLNYDGSVNTSASIKREDYTYGNSFNITLDSSSPLSIGGAPVNLSWDGSLQKIQTSVSYGAADSRNYDEHYAYQIEDSEIVMTGMEHYNSVDKSENRVEIYGYERVTDGSLKINNSAVYYLTDYSKSYTKSVVYWDVNTYGSALETRITYQGLDGYLKDNTLYIADHSKDRIEDYTYTQAADGSWKTYTIDRSFTKVTTQSVRETYSYASFYGETKESQIVYEGLSSDRSQDRTETYQYERQIDGSLQRIETEASYLQEPAKSYNETYTYCNPVQLSTYHQLVMTLMVHNGLSYTEGVVTDTDTSNDRIENYTYGTSVNEAISGDLNNDGDTTDTYSWDGTLKKTEVSVEYLFSDYKNYTETTAYQNQNGQVVEYKKKHIGTNGGDTSEDRIETYNYATSLNIGGTPYAWDGSLQKTNVEVRHITYSQKDYDESYIYGIRQGDVEQITMVHDGVTDKSESRTENYTYITAADGTIQKGSASVDYSVNGVSYDVANNYVEYYTYGLKSADGTTDYGQLVQLSKAHISKYTIGGIDYSDKSQCYQEEYEYGTSATITESDGTTTPYNWNGSLQRTRVSVNYSNLADFYQTDEFDFTYNSPKSETMSGLVIQALILMGAAIVYDANGYNGKHYRLIDPASGLEYVYKGSGDYYDPNNYELATSYYYDQHAGQLTSSPIYFDHGLTKLPPNAKNYTQVIAYKNQSGTLTQYKMQHTGLVDHSQDRIETYSYGRSVGASTWDESLQKTGTQVGYTINYNKDYEENYVWGIQQGSLELISMIHDGVTDKSESRTESYTYTRVADDGSIQKDSLTVDYSANGAHYNTAKNYIESYTYGLNAGGINYNQLVMTSKTHINEYVINGTTYSDQTQCWRENYTYGTSSTISNDNSVFYHYYSWNGKLEKTRTDVTYINRDSNRTNNFELSDKNYYEVFGYGMEAGKQVLEAMMHEGSVINRSDERIETYTYGTNISEFKDEGSCTVSSGVNNVINMTEHNFSNGDLVKFSGVFTPEGIHSNYTYYIINKSDNAFQISLTFNGPAVQFTYNTATTLEAFRVIGDFNNDGDTNDTFNWDGSVQKTQTVFDYVFNKAQSRIEKYTYEYDNSIGDVVQRSLIYKQLPYSGNVNDPNNINVDRSNDRTEVYEYERQADDGSLQKTKASVTYNTYQKDNYSFIYFGCDYDTYNNQYSGTMSGETLQSLIAKGATTVYYRGSINASIVEGYRLIDSATDIDYVWNGKGYELATAANGYNANVSNGRYWKTGYYYPSGIQTSYQIRYSQVFFSNPLESLISAKNYTESYFYDLQPGQLVMTQLRHTNSVDGSQNRTEDYTYGTNCSDGVTTSYWDGSLKRTAIKITYDNNSSKNIQETDVYGGLAEFGQAVLKTKITTPLNSDGTINASGNSERQDYTYGTDIRDSNGNIIAEWDGSLQKISVSVTYGIPGFYQSNSFSFGTGQIDGTMPGEAIQVLASRGATASGAAAGFYQKLVDSASGVPYVYKGSGAFEDPSSYEAATLANGYVDVGPEPERLYMRISDSTLHGVIYFVNPILPDPKSYIENYSYDLVSGETSLIKMEHIGSVDKSEDRIENYQYVRLFDGSLKIQILQVHYTTDYNKSYRKSFSYISDAYTYGSTFELEANVIYAGIDQDGAHIADHSQDRVETYTYTQVADGSWKINTIEKNYLYTTALNSRETYSYAKFYGEIKESQVVYFDYSQYQSNRTETFSYTRQADGSLQKTQTDVIYDVNVANNYREQYLFDTFDSAGNNYHQLVMTAMIHTGLSFDVGGISYNDTSEDRIERYVYGRSVDENTSGDLNNDGDTNDTYSWDGSLQKVGVSVSYSIPPYLQQNNNFTGIYAQQAINGTITAKTIEYFINKGAVSVYESAWNSYVLRGSYNNQLYNYVYKGSGPIDDVNSYELATADNGYSSLGTAYYTKDNKTYSAMFFNVNPIKSLDPDPRSYTETIAYQNQSGEIVEYIKKHIGISDHSQDRFETYSHANSVSSAGTTFTWDGSLQKTGIQVRYTLNSQKNYDESNIYGIRQGNIKLVTMVHDGVTDKSESRTETYSYLTAEDGSIQKASVNCDYSVGATHYNIADNYTESYTYGLSSSGGTYYGQLVQLNKTHINQYTINATQYWDQSQCWTETYTYDWQTGADSSLQRTRTDVTYVNLNGITPNPGLTDKNYYEVYYYNFISGDVVQTKMVHCGLGANSSYVRSETYTYARSLQEDAITGDLNGNGSDGSAIPWDAFVWGGSLKKISTVFDDFINQFDKTQSRIEKYTYEYNASLGQVIQKSMVNKAQIIAGYANPDQSDDRIEIYTYTRQLSTDGSVHSRH
ncbi:MAG: hypothetical protein NT145_04260 [Elusimicrobia bacterium]|nr:hypothetical protein [Elusimicrobiota bacterium]